MFKKLRNSLYAGATVLGTLLGTTQAWGFTHTTNLGQAVPMGTCSVNFFFEESFFSPGDYNAAIYVSAPNPMWAGDYEWSETSSTVPAGPLPNPVNAADIARCGFTNVSNVVGDGATDASFAAETYLGFTFRANDPSTGLLTDYEYAIVGATNTQIVVTAVPVVIDSTSPTVSLSSTTTTLSGVTPFTVTATFDEDITGFTDIANDVTITNATVTGITAVSASVYTLSVTPTESGGVSISIPAAAAQDLANNPNTASTALVIGGTIVADTQKAIASFMLGRANNLIANQPGLMRFLQNDGCSSFAASATNGSGAVSGCVSQGNTWAEITGSRSGDDSYTLGSFGAHSLMNPNLLVGAMLQVDYADDAVNNTSGSGWMVGPYFVARIPEQPIFIEGRLLYGQTDNDISPLGTFTDSFDTERFLAQLRATGEYNVQAFTLMPLLDVTYTDDTQKTYVDGLGNTIPGQTVSLTQVTAGMNFATDLEVASGSLELVGGLSGIYSASAGAAASPKFEHWRGRTHLGLNYGMATGGNLRVSTFYDGIGTNYESYGASLGFDMEF